MKVAFVSQPIDTIFSPGQNSVGACTYGLACSLAKSCEVVAYGLIDNHATEESDRVHRGVRFRFLSSTPRDRFVFNLRRRYAKLFPVSTPLSVSDVLFPEYAKKVAEDLQKQDCDVIHVQHCSQFVPVIRKLNLKAKIVLQLHAECFSQSRRLVEPRLQYVDLVTSVSNYVTEKTKREFPGLADRCHTMYNGIDSDEFCHERGYSSASRRRTKRILYVGAVSPHRGLHVLLEAFKIVVRAYPDVALDIVGPHLTYSLEETFDLKDHALVETVAPYYARNPLSLFKATVARHPGEAGSYVRFLKQKLTPETAGKVAFLGPVRVRSELIAHYYNADVFAFPSICNDSFGIPVVEAMAAGVPVVASRSGGVVETVKDRRTGLLVEKNSAPALAAALLRLLKDHELRENMGRASRERALRHFTWGRVARRMHERYQQLCERPAVWNLPAQLPFAGNEATRVLST